MEFEEVLQVLEVSEDERRKRRRAYEGTKSEAVYMHFHESNLQFCKEQQFSNEKRNTFVTIMDEALHGMIHGELTLGSAKPESDVKEYIFRRLVSDIFK